jgi:hypothetical protein
MRNLRSSAYGIILCLAVVGTVAFIYTDRFRDDHIFTAATVVLGVCVGFLTLSLRFSGGKDSEESAIASYGLVAGSSLAIAIAGIASFSCALADEKSGAVISGVIAILLLVGFFFINSFSNEALDAISEKKDYRSNHAQWARDLNDLATKAQSQSVRTAIRDRSDACRFLARDINQFAPMAYEIGECLASISAHVAVNEDDATLQCLSRLDDLFKQRADLLKRGRSKV